MKTRRVTLRRISWLLLAVTALAAFVYFVAIPSREAWSHARTLSEALTGARSVAIVEFEHGFIGPELVFSRVSASPQHIAALRTATGAWFAPIPRRSAACFDPHHRVEIVRADGSAFLFEVCFKCRNFALGGPHATTLPASWRNGLSQFFTSVGMQPGKDYAALAKTHPDYHLVEEAFRDLDRQVEQFDKIPQK